MSGPLFRFLQKRRGLLELGNGLRQLLLRENAQKFGDRFWWISQALALPPRCGAHGWRIQIKQMRHENIGVLRFNSEWVENLFWTQISQMTF